MIRNDNVLYRIAIILNVILLFMSLAMLVTNDLAGSIFYALVSLGGFFLVMLARAYKKHLISILHIGVMLVFILSATIFMRGAWPWYADIILHFLGGFFAALYSLAWFYERVPRGLILFIFGVGCAMIVGVVWEFAEAFGSLVTSDPGFALQSFDIIGDLLCDFLGGVLASALFCRFRR